MVKGWLNHPVPCQVDVAPLALLHGGSGSVVVITNLLKDRFDDQLPLIIQKTPAFTCRIGGR
ncbi:hypothetical protein D3C80_1688460 [compost metagenome]